MYKLKKMIDVFNILEAYSKIRPLNITKIYSRLQGYIFVNLKYDGKEIIETENNIHYNIYGQVFEKGECMLFPDEKCAGWTEFVKNLLIKEHDKELVQGNICLVKKIYTSPWTLAVYHQKVDKSYQAQVGKTYEIFQYCINFEKNKEYLGRESFPSWFIDVDNLENMN
jgi:uncharacterized protein YfaT (DUF1175 family)